MCIKAQSHLPTQHYMPIYIQIVLQWHKLVTDHVQ